MKAYMARDVLNAFGAQRLRVISIFLYADKIILTIITIASAILEHVIKAWDLRGAYRNQLDCSF